MNLILIFFFFSFRRCWKRCLWNSTALAYQMEPSLLYLATWLDELARAQTSSTEVDLGVGRWALWVQHNCGSVMFDWQALCEEEAYWLYDCVPARVQGGRVLWISEADLVFNRETVNRHLLIPPKDNHHWPLRTSVTHTYTDHLPFDLFSVLKRLSS